MATYIPGSKSYMPEFKPFTPDYRFLSAVLDTKTTRYNTNYRHLNDLYSKIVYAPLSREDTRFMRDQYTEGLSEKLEKISGMDLSLVQNVDAAKGVFKPFFETDIIVKDMVMTKAFEREQQYANSLMNSQDKEARDMYWTTGLEAMSFKMKDFVEADTNTALGMSLPKYVPNADLYKLSLDILKESGLSVKQDELSKSGQWIITRENGDLVTKPALEMIQRKLGDDPRVIQAYYTQSYVDGRKYAEEGLKNGKFNTVDQGQREWALQTIREYNNKAIQRSNEQKTEIENKKASVTSWQLFMDKYGIKPGSQQEKAMKKQYGDYLALQQGLETTNGIISETSNINNEQSTTDLLNRAYNAMMQYNMKDDMIAAARTFGNMKASTTIKMENPEFTRQRQFQIDKAMEAIRQANRMQLAKFEQDLENEANKGLLAPSEFEIKYGERGSVEIKNIEDFIAHGNQQLEEYSNAIENSRVLQILQALPHFQPDDEGNNTFSITTVDGESMTGPIGGPHSTGGNTLYEKLMQQEVDAEGNPTGKLKYESTIKKYYNLYNSYLNPPKDSNGFEISDDEAIKNITLEMPDLSFNIETYRRLKAGFSQLNDKELKLNEVINKRNTHLKEQYELAVKSGLYDDYDEVQGFIDQGLDIGLFSKNGNSWILKTKEQFINEYVAGAKAGKYKDDLSWMSRNTPFGQDSGHDANYMGRNNDNAIIDPYTGITRGTSNKKTFLEKEARKDAAMLYDHMYTILNNTQNGAYSGEAEAIKSAIKDNTSLTNVTRTNDLFKTYDVGKAFMGRNPLGTAVDLISSPTYKLDINPLNINNDPTAAALIGDLIRQYNAVPNQAMTIQPGVLSQKEGEDFTQPIDEVGKYLFEAFLREMRAYSTNPKEMPKSNMPFATIRYNPTYNPAESTEGDYSAYEINFAPDWVKKQLGLRTAGSESTQKMEPSQAADYQTITFAFEDDYDISVRQDDAYNYSNVMSSINNTNNNQYVNNIANGGSVRVTQDINGDFIGTVKLQQYNPETGGFESLPIQTFNLNEYIYNNTGTRDMMSYLDSAVEIMVMQVQNKAEQNKKLLEETNKK